MENCSENVCSTSISSKLISYTSSDAVEENIGFVGVIEDLTDMGKVIMSAV